MPTILPPCMTGEPLDPVNPQHLGHLMQRRVLADGDDGRVHDVADGPDHVRLRHGGVPLARFGQDGQPPFLPMQPVLVATAKQVAFAHHSDQASDVVHDRNRADAVLQQQGRYFFHSCPGCGGDDGRTHDVAGRRGPVGDGWVVMHGRFLCA